MKILIVAPYFYPNIGGMETYIYNLGVGLKEKYNSEVVVVTSNQKEGKYSVENIQGMKVYRLPYLFKLSNTPINPFWYFAVKKIIKFEKPDVINAHAPVPFMSDIALRAKGNLPYILTYHAGSMKKNKVVTDMIIGLYERFFLNTIFIKSDKIITTFSPKIFPLLDTYEKKIIQISPAIDINIFKAKKSMVKNTLLYVGRIEKTSEWKGIAYLLDAVAIVKKDMPDIKLVLVGSGDSLEDYKNYAKTHGLSRNTKFVGMLHGKSLAKQYNDTNVLILPSTSNAESFGIVLIEAMACKKPVIGSRVGGIPYVIDNGENGLLVEPKNTQQLAHTITTLLKNSTLAKRLGENGYKKVIEKFTLEKQLRKTHQTFTSL
jgi:glycosyltransferase involved in cell wall biosynthesis